jgi:twitching motility protein PilT
MAMNFEQLLKFGVEQEASSIHLQADSSPQLRIGGLIRNIEGAPVKADELKAFIASVAPNPLAADIDRSLAEGSVFSTSTAAGRFRCTTYSHIGGPGIVLRVVPSKIRTVEELNLPRAVRDVALASRGLILIVGPGSSGKTATLAAMIDAINASSLQKVVTIEAPVEYLHPNKKSIVTHVEIGRNASTFEHGLGLALKQDADVIAVGELREPVVARMVLEAVESGRKILAVMTGQSVEQGIAQFISLVSRDTREDILTRVAAALEAVIVQQLAKTRDGKLRPAVGIFRGGPITTRPILENKIKDLHFFIEGRQGGMQSLDQHLLELHQAGLISGTETMRLANNPEAVGMGLRAIRQASAAATTTGSLADGSSRPAPSATSAEPGLAP